MKAELKIPSVGESITEVTIAKILKPTGSKVKRDEEVVEIETDKLNQALYSPDSGVITFTVQEGDTVKVGTVIATVEVQESKTEQKVEEEKIEQPRPVSKVQPIEGARHTKEEWLAGLKEEKTAPATPSAQIPVSHKVQLTQEKVTRKKLTQFRKVIAERLVQVKNETAMLTTFNEVDMSHIIGLREKYKEAFQKKHGVRLGFMSFFVKAVTYALEDFPEVNSYIDRDDQVFRNTIDIGVAVSTEKGLFVPVIRDCEELAYQDIEKQIDDFAARAKNGTLTVDELKGGGFTITNGGVFGSLLSTPILNPPQSGILGMHKIMKRPVVVDDQIVIRPMMYLALSYDHRVIDGREAVNFLVHIKTSLEDPERMVLEV
jgi:2-oxoglutarate dehydrogenase E2 component (dihydrolipoamide succinyltransferase)